MASSLMPLNCLFDIERKRTMDSQSFISKPLGPDMFWNLELFRILENYSVCSMYYATPCILWSIFWHKMYINIYIKWVK